MEKVTLRNMFELSTLSELGEDDIELLMSEIGDKVDNYILVNDSFEREIERLKSIKKIIENNTLFIPGKSGCMPTSQVVAPVRGIATRGPMQSMINKARILTTTGFTFVPKSVNLTPFSTIVITPKKGATIPVVKKPATA